MCRSVYEKRKECSWKLVSPKMSWLWYLVHGIWSPLLSQDLLVSSLHPWRDLTDKILHLIIHPTLNLSSDKCPLAISSSVKCPVAILPSSVKLVENRFSWRMTTFRKSVWAYLAWSECFSNISFLRNPWEKKISCSFK